MKSYIIGIDPGLSGGLAFYNPDNLIVYATPVNELSFIKAGKKRKRNEMDVEAVRELIVQYDGTQFNIECAYLEHVSAMPGQGVTGVFRFGQNFGQWQGILGGLGIRTVLIRPQTWKAFFGLNRSKDTSLGLAREYWPENAAESFRLKKHDGLAEAALIAKYGFENKK